MIRRLWADDDFHIPIELGDEVQQTLGREAREFVVAQLGYMGLGNAEDAGDGDLRQFALLDQVVDPHGELDAQLALARVGESQVTEHIARAGLHPLCLPCHSAPRSLFLPSSIVHG